MEDQDPLFTALCSYSTVQSDDKGFFNIFYESVVEKCTESWIKHDFGVLKSDREKLQKLFTDSTVNDLVLGTLENVREVYREKCAKFSLEKRTLGERLTKDGDLNSALIILSQAVMRAPVLGISIINRLKTVLKLLYNFRC